MNEKDMKDAKFLITGAGSLGTELVKQLWRFNPHTIRILDNSEQALFKLQLKFPDEKRLRFILGDIHDREKVDFACDGIDYVIHTAAKKFIDFGEYNPDIFINTNIHGTENVIKSCLAQKVKKAIFISSDKALHRFGIYAKTKAIGEDLWLWGHNISQFTRFSIIRPGNFSPSEGSVFQIWDEAIKRDGKIRVTNKEMKRYFIPIKEMADFVFSALEIMKGGEIYIPKMQEREIYKMALEYANGDETKIEISGLRLGEELTEILMSEIEILNAIEHNNYYEIPSFK